MKVDSQPSIKKNQTNRVGWAVFVHAFNPSTWETEAVEINASLVYRVSSRTARGRQRTPVSNKRKRKIQSWRDGSAVKSTDCSFRGPEFNSQPSNSASQPSLLEIQFPLLVCLKTEAVYSHK